MLLHLIKKEILEQLLSLRFAISCMLCLVVILASLFVLTKDYKEELLDYHTNVVMHRNEVMQNKNDGGILIWRGVKVDRPLNPMKIFFKGIDQENSVTVRVTSFTEPEFEADYEGNPVISLFPTIDLAFFVGTIMSLLAIAFSYDAISGEKENGTLRLLLSYSVPRDLVLLSKWIGGYLSLIAPFVVAILCGLIVVSLYPDVHLTGDHWLELGLILLLALLYISAVYSLGLFVSARTRMASTSITVLLLLWVIVVLAVPNVAPYVAAQISPISSVQSVERQKQQWERDEDAKFEKEYKEWREKNEHLPEGERWAVWDEMKKNQYLKVTAEQEKINEHFGRQMDEQIRLAETLSRISPLSSLSYAVSDLSGTGRKERSRFFKTLIQYKKDVCVFAFDKWIEVDKIEKYDQYDVTGYPKFIYEESPLQDRIKDIFGDVLALAIWNLVFFMASYLSFLRYDVR